jgi:DNA-binding MarR family transcriptional regulator
MGPMVVDNLSDVKFLFEKSKHLSWRKRCVIFHSVATGKVCTASGREAWQYLYDLMFSDEMHERMHSICEDLDLSPPLTKALMSIEPGQPKPMKGLSDQWHCDASYVTSLVDGLEERGIAERRSNPSDRRAKLIALTPVGEKVRQELIDRLQEPPDCVSVLSGAEQRTLRTLLRKIRDAATET